MAERKFRRGDAVRFRLATRFVRGVVKEDRGPIGIKGRRLYLVEFSPDRDAPSSFIELPADELQYVPDQVPTE